MAADPGDAGAPGGAAPAPDRLLDVRGLRTCVAGPGGPIPLVEDVSFSLRRGETLGLVGESGSGKTMAALSVMRLLANTKAWIAAGAVRFEDEELLTKSEPEMRAIRGNRIAMIYQEPMSSLNPVFTVGQQLIEAIRLHRPVGRSEARAEAIRLLGMVGVASPETRVDAYPHQLSGGMRQRVMIAMALSCDPALLIADEPTTALDVTVQAEILDLLRRLKQDRGMAMMLITHDLGVVAEEVDRVAVMYAGRIVEIAPTAALFAGPQHPYTAGLLASIPKLDEERDRLAAIEGVVPNPADPPSGCRFHPRCAFAREICTRREPPLLSLGDGHVARCWRNTGYQPDAPPHATATPAPPAPPPAGRTAPLAASARPEEPGDPVLLQVGNLAKHFPAQDGFLAGKGVIRAVDGIDFHLNRGETLALVGESGCGKSTTGRLILRLLEASSGEIRFKGQDLRRLSRRDMRDIRRSMQLVFQDPFESLNPRLTIEAILREPLQIHRLARRREQRDRVAGLLESVGLSGYHMARYPHEFSGGQRQRIGVARALASRPDIIVCDEPVSALDVSIQAQILNLLRDLQNENAIAYLFVAHDLSVVKHIAHRVAVMHLGKIVEIAPKEALFARPQHPYTEALLSAIPMPGSAARRSGRIILQGEIPSPAAPPSGCRFRTRCPYAAPVCAAEEPPLLEIAAGHHVACHFRKPAPRSPDAGAARPAGPFAIPAATAGGRGLPDPRRETVP